MTQEELHFVAELVKRRSGQILTPGKAYLIESRLADMAGERGHASVGALLRALRDRHDEVLAAAVTDALTINETFFFRDAPQFDYFGDTVIPVLAKARAGGVIRVWCSAASTGQEPYSLVMLMEELGPRFPGVRLEILGSDISQDCLQKARAGRYSRFEVQRGLTAAQLARHLEPEGAAWRLSPKVKAGVSWRQFNLLEDLRQMGRFDVIFCRNVLMYFDQATRRRVLDGLTAVMADDGYLFVGGAEILLGFAETLTPSPGIQGVFQRANRIASPQISAQASSNGRRG
jgi:chemotaxis protein methyltransferase CheR